MTAEQSELLATLERAGQITGGLIGRGLRFASSQQRESLKLLSEEFAVLGAVGLASASERAWQALQSGQQAPAALLSLQARLLLAERLLSAEVAKSLVEGL